MFFNLIGVVFRSLSWIEDTVATFAPNISCSAIHSINSEGDLILLLVFVVVDPEDPRPEIFKGDLVKALRKMVWLELITPIYPITPQVGG